VLVRLADVARRVGVSTATVSRALANKPHVSAEVRQRVLAVVEELNYQPNRVARSLQGRRSKIIGVIISDIQNPFFTRLVRAVENVAHRNNYAIFLCNTDEDGDKEEFYVNLMLAENVAGVIACPTMEESAKWQKLHRAEIPFVVVDRRLPGAPVDTVVVDNVGAAYDLVAHLIENGHQRIGAVLGEHHITTGRERYEGYARALEAHNLPLSLELICQGMPREENGYHFTRELLNLPERPTAFFTGNNLLTLGTLRAIREANLAIPDDIALVAFDELEWMSLIQPQLTVVAQPTYQLGEMAAQLLFQRLAGDGKVDGDRMFEEVVLKPEILFRESSMKVRHKI
jgi:DNA-binding LacI/PurR family transcriptional regulator